jgi:F0F1-type ATP synthase membrane subunit b/b'
MTNIINNDKNFNQIEKNSLIKICKSLLLKKIPPILEIENKLTPTDECYIPPYEEYKKYTESESSSTKKTDKKQIENELSPLIDEINKKIADIRLKILFSYDIVHKNYRNSLEYTEYVAEIQKVMDKNYKRFSSIDEIKKLILEDDIMNAYCFALVDDTNRKVNVSINTAPKRISFSEKREIIKKEKEVVQKEREAILAEIDNQDSIAQKEREAILAEINNEPNEDNPSEKQYISTLEKIKNYERGILRDFILKFITVHKEEQKKSVKLSYLYEIFSNYSNQRSKTEKIISEKIISKKLLSKILIDELEFYHNSSIRKAHGVLFTHITINATTDNERLEEIKNKINDYLDMIRELKIEENEISSRLNLLI